MGRGRGRLKLVVTRVKSLQLAYLDDWETKAELIDANMASAHIPFFLDWRPFATYRCAPLLPAPLPLEAPAEKSSILLKLASAAAQQVNRRLRASSICIFVQDCCA